MQKSSEILIFTGFEPCFVKDRAVFQNGVESVLKYILFSNSIPFRFPKWYNIRSLVDQGGREVGIQDKIFI